MSGFLLLATWLLALPADAVVRRVHWREVKIAGRAPPHLQARVRAHLGITLEPLGLQLAKSGSTELSAEARCRFSTASRAASCTLEVSDTVALRHAQRHVEIPYRDADDFAQTLALLVADALQADLRIADLGPPPAAPPATPEPSPIEPEPPTRSSLPASKPPPPPPTPSPPPGPVSPPPEAARAPAEARAKSSTPTPVASVATSGSREPAGWALALGPLLALDNGDTTPLYGLAVQARRFTRILELGACLTLAGNRTSAAGFALDFFRIVAAPRIGLRLAWDRMSVGISGGPALLLLRAQASPGGGHTLASLAGLIGGRLAASLGSRTAIELGGDLLVPATQEQIVAGSKPVLSFGVLSFELSLSLSYQL